MSLRPWHANPPVRFLGRCDGCDCNVTVQDVLDGEAVPIDIDETLFRCIHCEQALDYERTYHAGRDYDDSDLEEQRE